MADIDARRLRMLDGVGPQQIKYGSNEPEFIVGSDGAQHVKIVDSTGKPVSRTPTRDVDVKTAIDSVRNAIEAIDIPATDYATILGKLDDLNASVVDNKVVLPDTFDVKDNLVLAKLSELENEIKSVKERMDGTFDTQVTGSDVEDEILIERQIRTVRSSFAHADPPKRAIGAIFEFKVFAATGSFDDKSGAECAIYSNNEGINASIWGVRTAKVTQRGGVIYMYPYNISLGDATIDGGPINDVKVVNLPIHSYLRTRIEITGTFEGNEGIDCELTVKWLF